MGAWSLTSLMNSDPGKLCKEVWEEVGSADFRLVPSEFEVVDEILQQGLP